MIGAGGNNRSISVRNKETRAVDLCHWIETSARTCSIVYDATQPPTTRMEDGPELVACKQPNPK
jgi:hypothetical protein